VGNVFFMMVGLPGSGKSHYAQWIRDTYDANIHASDELRYELFGDESINDKNDELFAELHRRIKQDLEAGKSAVYDATNINYKRRKAFLDELKKFNCQKTCVLAATPYEICLEQNKARSRTVPEHVIRKMYTHFYIPQKYEGWDDIHIVWNKSSNRYKLFPWLSTLDSFQQDNPHHTLSLGDHLTKCWMRIKKEDSTLEMAARLHDIGKPFTKSFTNGKGEPTEIAHYFQHHLVGAYDAMFRLKSEGYTNDDILDICQLITWHMQPYFQTTDKAKDKFAGLVGQEFYNRLMVLHEADRAAH
jgi:predicted kinase